MHTRFKKVLAFFPVAALLILPYTLRPSSLTYLTVRERVVKMGSELTVTPTSATSVSLIWIIEDGPYRVTVSDLTTPSIVGSFNTIYKYASVTGLTSGHTYRFSVKNDSGYVIAEDVVM